MLKKLKLFYYFYETDIIKDTNNTKDTYNNITGID